MAQATEVTWEDQQRINTFGRLNNRLAEAKAELDVKKKLLEDLEEAGNELLVADDTSVRYVTGECFVTLSNDTAEARLAAATAEAEQGAGKLRDELASIEKEMAALKVLLYGRFGSSINLEND